MSRANSAATRTSSATFSSQDLDSSVQEETTETLPPPTGSNRCACREVYGWVSLVIFISAVPAFVMLKNYPGIPGWVCSAVFCLLWTLIIRAERLELSKRNTIGSRSLTNTCCGCSWLVSERARHAPGTSKTLFALICGVFGLVGLAWAAYCFYYAATVQKGMNLIDTSYLAGISSIVGAKWAFYCFVHVNKLRKPDTALYRPIL